MRFRAVVSRALAFAAAICFILPSASAQEEAKSPPPEPVKAYDFDALFEPGDGWKKTPQVFVWNNEAEPETLDPALMTFVPDHQIALALFEGLVTHHPETLEPIPGVAESWTISPDLLVYTFKLRKDAKWSNGDPVTAEDFRWSWERALTHPNCQYKEMFSAIAGADEFAAAPEGKRDWGVVRISIPDPHTMVVRLKAPTAYFLEICAFVTLMPVHRKTVEAHPTDWTKPEHIVANGPFALEKWEPRAKIEMVPNPHWWNRRIVRLERMVIKAIDDQSTSYNDYLSGGVDWIRSVASGKVTDAQLHGDYYVQPYLGSYFFRFNVTKKPFDDVRVRKAFNAAVDKKVICDSVLKAGQTPATGVVAPGIAGYPELQGLGYDPVGARALLAEAGYPEGRGFPEVRLLYNTQESHKQVCEKLVEMWKTNLGVRVSLENRESKVYLAETRQMNYDIQRGGWIGDYADPATFLDMWCKDRGNNNTGWSDPEYEDLLAKSVVESDPKKRYAILAEAERILCTEHLPVMPLYYYVNQGMLRPRVKGWRENVRDLHPFQYIYLDPPAK